ncbi:MULTISPECIES: PLP-dependent aspartate aminotransferase family protein [unclassified Nitratiruptor]|uniref:trans-sulfuration enzyme family protein n=1 Tax=unclassified Nitratiruptor TaxID=2624044 RepID=UPI00191510E4|nr:MULTISPECIES: PLP-dependent transferase [unclassified Nitratiruptor]BCD60591.1 O-acetylhomoserine (thiol)-lyase [Nitratiruptor sp. YY08-10]BCD64522.1 O-acetylhomoserine (thiol)-lyase [Nitratiruptor sp. YY08-14]
MDKFERFQTAVVQMIGSKEGAISPPIVGSASFAYGSPQNGEAIFSGDLPKPLYARMGNPTNAKLESILAMMDEAEGAVVTASGMGAIAMTVTSMLESGDEVACIGGLFGGSYAFFKETAARLGIRANFYKADELPKISPKTKMIYCESIGNPNMQIVDFEALGMLAKEHNILYVVDNTLTPLLFNPFEYGADLVLYSTTKIIAGFSQALGGAVVFRSVREELVQNYPFMEKFIEKLGNKAYMGMLKKRALRDFGMSQDAFGSYLTMLGLETLAWRVQRVSQSAKEVALALQSYVKVIHPAVSNDPKYERYFPYSCGQMLGLDFGSKERAFAFLQKAKLPFITANLGDSRTLALHMASTIYRDFSEDERKFLGVSDGFVRVSIGLEHPEAIIDDFTNAIKEIG